MPSVKILRVRNPPYPLSMLHWTWERGSPEHWHTQYDMCLATLVTTRWSETGHILPIATKKVQEVLQKSCSSVLLLVSRMPVPSGSGNQPLCRTVAFTGMEVRAHPSSVLLASPAPTWRVGTEVKETLLLRIVFFFSTSTPVWESQPSPFEPYRHSLRSTFAFHLMIISADRKQRWSVSLLCEEPNATRATRDRAGKGHVCGATKQVASKDIWFMEESLGLILFSSQLCTLWKRALHFSLVMSPECSIMSATTVRQQTLKFSQPFNKHGQTSTLFVWSFD